jgi:hypothetical protein
VDLLLASRPQTIWRDPHDRLIRAFSVTRKRRWFWITSAFLAVVPLSWGAAGAADKSKVDGATIREWRQADRPGSGRPAVQGDVYGRRPYDRRRRQVQRREYQGVLRGQEVTAHSATGPAMALACAVSPSPRRPTAVPPGWPPWKNCAIGAATQTSPRNYPGSCSQREPKRAQVTYVRSANLRRVVWLRVGYGTQSGRAHNPKVAHGIAPLT